MDMTGLWKMTGHQNMFPNVQWEADLLLKAGGALTWTETKGANVGAARRGDWTLSDTTFYFQYQAPTVGMVTWNGSMDGQGKNMNGTYNAGGGNAYGGDWSAHKP
jgi:hypothetical protein